MKHISIIGGGISGLAVLHYLKQRFSDSVEITLFEREATVGGTIHSVKQDSCLFEWGPNGFLDNQPTTLGLVKELGLTSRLIEASPTANRRYIQINGELHTVPANPIDLVRTPLLSFNDKMSLIAGLLKNVPANNSIYDYVSRRFSPNIAESLVDPFISGIYAGDIQRLHLSALPKLKYNGFRKTHMLSFKKGMGEIIEALYNRYQNHIQTDRPIDSIQPHTNISIVATPAYAAANIVGGISPSLAHALVQIPYAPVAVAGLLFKEDSFKKKPDGFGYLVPSKEHKDILGVLIESNVYAGRAEEGQVMLRVILGGTHHSSIINDGTDRLLAKAIKEIDSTYGIVTYPTGGLVKLWPRAIPQYEMNYPRLRRTITAECAKIPGLYLCANYLDGISFNDCIKNARSLAKTIKI